MVHPYSSIDTTAAWKKLRFILSVRSDFHMIESLSIAVHAFVSRVSMSFSVEKLEYTLLKPDCHSWSISKMQSGREDTLEEWYAIKLCFKLGRNATETYGMLQTSFRAFCMNRASVFEWHKRFKECKKSVMDDERCGRSKEVNTPELIGQRVRVRVNMSKF